MEIVGSVVAAIFTCKILGLGIVGAVENTGGRLSVYADGLLNLIPVITDSAVFWQINSGFPVLGVII